MVCDVTSDPAVCAECYDGNDSRCIDRGMVCDTQSRVCIECLVDGDCVSAGTGPRHCLPDENVCVDCYLDEHCPSDMSCDLDLFICLPKNGRGLCDVCTSDSECGGAADLCLMFVGPQGQIIDNGCGQACSPDNPCPPGFRCGAAGDIGQCIPYNTEPVTTCAAIRDMGKPCDINGGGSCGVIGADDALCAPSIGGFLCSVSCENASGGGNMCANDWKCGGISQFFFCQP